MNEVRSIPWHKVLEFLQIKNKSLDDWLKFIVELYNYVDQNCMESS